MNYLNNLSFLSTFILLFGCCSRLPELANCLQQQQQPLTPPQQQNVQADYEKNFPYYMASPIADFAELEQMQMQQNLAENPASNTLEMALQQQQINQRSLKQQQQQQKIVQTGRKISNNIDLREPPIENQVLINTQQQQQQLSMKLPPQLPIPQPAQQKDTCLYDKRYFSKLDQCLAKKPYPTVGLLAFKNEDLLVHSNSQNKHGCVFVLNNGLFKNYQISRYFVDNNDEQCLDNSKISLTMGFSNITLSYLWTLRCLNRADQMLDDATLSGPTSSSVGGERGTKQAASICIGSSQNFGFASLQLTNLEAQVELVTDIYKNWRVTNVTVNMINPSQTMMPNATSRSGVPTENLHSTDSSQADTSSLLGTNIKDYVFETLDGDELNWRYLHLFQNWTRNRMHANFLAQYKRFLWISMQRCLTESSDKLPTKLMDIFTNQKFS